MKQLFILKKTAALNGGAATPKNISGMAAGAIGFYHLAAPTAWLAAAATKDFAFCVGKGSGIAATVFPEVDFKTLDVVFAPYSAGSAFTVNLDFGGVTPVSGKTYTIVLTKNGVVPNERNTYTYTHTIQKDETITAEQLATILYKQIKNAADAGTIPMSVGFNDNTIEITCLNKDEQWGCVLGDGFGVIASTSEGTDTYTSGVTRELNPAKPGIGTPEYMKDLMASCAGDKGITLTDTESSDLYPGYPEALEEGAQYNIISLHFATSRKAGKTGDEQVWQYVYLAVPTGATALASIKTILGIS